MPEEDFWTSSDPLGEALHCFRMRGAFYSRAELTAPWGMVLPPMRNILLFHVVTHGRCWLSMDGVDGTWLTAGDLHLVPHGRGHVLQSAPGVPATDLFDLPRELLSERYERIRHGAGGTPTRMICGAVSFDHPAAQHLISLLPPMLILQSSVEGSEWLSSLLRLMASEAQAMRPGGETVVTRLADVLVIQAIRDWIGREDAARTGWIGALRDPQVGRAMTLIHRHPERSWTLANLARAVGMSRSGFAARFTQLVGEPAMAYATRYRMQMAMAALQEGNARLSELAEQFGYTSEAAFSRAFKRWTGVSPGAARRGAETMPQQG